MAILIPEGGRGATWSALSSSGLTIHVKAMSPVRAGDSVRAASTEVHRAARAHRFSMLVWLSMAAAQAAGAFLRRLYAAHQQRREASAIRQSLQQLDDHTLRDLGLSRDEISSVAAEATGIAECTRARVEQNLYGLPR